MKTTLHIKTLQRLDQTFEPCADDPRVLSTYLAQQNLALNTRCNGQGWCHGCNVQLERGSLRHVPTGELAHAPCRLLACQSEWVPETDVVVSIPSRSLLAHAPAVAEDFKVNVPVGSAPLVEGEYGIAIDIGTTTVVVLLTELVGGRMVARSSNFNQQIQFGDDVLARISLCGAEPKMIARLQEAVCRETLLPLMRDVVRKAGVEWEKVGGVAIAANTTMMHLLVGVDPTPLGVVPFTPHFLDHRVTSLHALGIGELPDLPVHLLPGLAAYIGADITAGIFATGTLASRWDPALLVDVGTNGEIVLCKGGKLFACATAAGPAFEGRGLSCGMRAAEGAVERIAITRSAEGKLRLTVKTIGNVELERSPGICGSAYIDFLAQGRESGLLMESGRFDPDVVATHPALFVSTDAGIALRLGGEHAPYIVETDIAALLQAKAAVAAGIQTLLDREGVTEMPKLYLAGGFGMHLSIPHAIGCGLLPGFAPENVEVVGNTSLAGAYLTLLDREVLPDLARIQSSAHTIELNEDPDFEDRYIDHLRLE